MQIIKQTIEEKFNMYMESCTKEELAKMLIECNKHIPPTSISEYKFKIGDKAYKPKGYKFPCTVVSIFKTTSGEIRIVGEMDDNGMLHIFNENQLEK